MIPNTKDVIWYRDIENGCIEWECKVLKGDLDSDGPI